MLSASNLLHTTDNTIVSPMTLINDGVVEFRVIRKPF